MPSQRPRGHAGSDLRCHQPSREGRRRRRTPELRGAWERNIPECVACHGPAGMGVGASFPPLAGQSAQYLGAQLNAWRRARARTIRMI